jgi:hypothetical protein
MFQQECLALLCDSAEVCTLTGVMRENQRNPPSVIQPQSRGSGPWGSLVSHSSLGEAPTIHFL